MTLRADALANSLSNKEYRKFWKSMNRSNNNKAVKYASTIAAVVTMILLIDGIFTLKIFIIPRKIPYLNLYSGHVY